MRRLRSAAVLTLIMAVRVAGAASASAAGFYDPPSDLKGAFAGAPPADLAAVAKNLDGHYAAAFLLFAVASMNYAYPGLDIPSLLNDKGRQVQAQVETECTADGLIKPAFTQTKDLTADDRPITDYLGEQLYAAAVAEQLTGLRKPAAPVLVAHSVADDIVPYAQGLAMPRS